MKLASFKLRAEDIELLDTLVTRGLRRGYSINKSKLVRYALQLLTSGDLVTFRDIEQA